MSEKVICSTVKSTNKQCTSLQIFNFNEHCVHYKGRRDSSDIQNGIISQAEILF